jgi:uncharacterized protein (DUF1015 family)
LAKIIPFKAIRPTRDKVSLVTSRSYDEYSPAELASQLDFNPFSFLHVLNPAYVNQQKVGLEKRFKLVAQKYKDFKEEHIFIKEEQPVFFIYEIETKSQTFTGIIAGTTLDDYRNNVIKKHEDTLQYRVELFKDYLHQTRFNTEPVLITYPENAELSAWILAKKQTECLYEFSTTRREKHQLWKIDAPEEIAWLQEKFEGITNLYIADGHHRSASSVRLYEERLNSGQTLKENVGYFLGYFVEQSQLNILEFNRLVKSLNGFSSAKFLSALEKIGKITELITVEKPSAEHQIHFFLNNKWYKFVVDYSLIDNAHPVKSLDSDLLTELILKPLLGIEDLKTSNQIEFIPGNESLEILENKVNSGDFEIAFVLFPVSIEQVKRVADNQMNMPPKSTWVEPKLRSGLTIYNIN